MSFKVTFDHPDHQDEIVTYNQALDYILQQIVADDDPDNIMWCFEEIVGHEGPLKLEDPSYKGSAYNVLMLWSDGTKTYDPLGEIGADLPVPCALYAKENGLLDTPGWKRFKPIARQEKKL